MQSVPKKYLTILGFAICIRLLIIIWSLHYPLHSDVIRYADWGRITYYYGLSDSYSVKHIHFGIFANNQPPGTLYIVSIMYGLCIGFIHLLKDLCKLHYDFLTLNFLLPIFLRIPGLIADILLGSSIFLIVKSNKNISAAYFASSLFLFNPVVIYNSAFWGQLDAINNLFALLSLLFLLRNSFFTSILFFGLSLYVKLSLFPLLPLYVFLLFYQNRKTQKNLLLAFTFCICCIIIFTIPVSNNPIFWLSTFILNNESGELKNITNFAFNFWWLVTKPLISFSPPPYTFDHGTTSMKFLPPLNFRLVQLSLDMWGYILYFLSLFPIILLLYPLRKRAVTPSQAYLSYALASLIIFLFFPRMHERYFYPFIPFCSVSIGLLNKRFYIFSILCLLNLINLYLVWHPFSVFFFPYDLLHNRLFQWCICLEFVIFSIFFYSTGLKQLFQDTSTH